MFWQKDWKSAAISQIFLIPEKYRVKLSDYFYIYKKTVRIKKSEPQKYEKKYIYIILRHWTSFFKKCLVARGFLSGKRYSLSKIEIWFVKVRYLMCWRKKIKNFPTFREFFFYNCKQDRCVWLCLGRICFVLTHFRPAKSTSSEKKLKTRVRKIKYFDIFDNCQVSLFIQNCCHLIVVKELSLSDTKTKVVS